MNYLFEILFFGFIFIILGHTLYQAFGPNRFNIDTYAKMIEEKKKSLSKDDYKKFITKGIAEMESIERTMRKRGKPLHPLNAGTLKILRKEKAELDKEW